MKFVLVNGRTPNPPSFCALCCQSIGENYLREHTTRLSYCDQNCYLGDCKIEAHPRNADASDEALIKAIGRRDRNAMAILYGRHHVRVYRFVLRVTGDAILAEDIVSDVFLEVWRHADRFKSKAQVSTWLLAIARNKGITAVRRHCDQHLDVDALEVEDPADDPEALISKSDRRKVIQRALSELSAAQREVIELVYYHEKSVGEVAKIVGAPTSTVKTRMFYARRRMEAIIKSAEHGGLFDAAGPRKHAQNNSRQAGARSEAQTS